MSMSLCVCMCARCCPTCPQDVGNANFYSKRRTVISERNCHGAMSKNIKVSRQIVFDTFWQLSCRGKTSKMSISVKNNFWQRAAPVFGPFRDWDLSEKRLAICFMFESGLGLEHFELLPVSGSDGSSGDRFSLCWCSVLAGRYGFSSGVPGVPVGSSESVPQPPF